MQPLEERDYFTDHSILKELETTGFIDRVATQYGLK